MTREMKAVGAAALLCIIALAGFCFATSDIGITEDLPLYELPRVEPPETAAASLPVRAMPDRYVLREDGGQVAVFLLGSDEPLMSLDVAAAKLRSADAEMLREGIEVEGDEALWQLIEDFSS